MGVGGFVIYEPGFKLGSMGEGAWRGSLKRFQLIVYADLLIRDPGNKAWEQGKGRCFYFRIHARKAILYFPGADPL